MDGRPASDLLRNELLRLKAGLDEVPFGVVQMDDALLSLLYRAGLSVVGRPAGCFRTAASAPADPAAMARAAGVTVTG